MGQRSLIPDDFALRSDPITHEDDMNLDLLDLWTHMNNLVRGVVILLSLQALASIAVFVDRVLMMIAGYRSSRRFAKAAGRHLASGNYKQVLELAREKKHVGHLSELISGGIKTFLRLRKEGQSHEKAVELTERALERRGESLSDRLHRGLNVLASTGSTAPFIGLLGTVFGILNAFRMIGEEGSGGIGTIGGAIAEALIVTGYGLIVAIPTVLLFNALSSRLAKYEAVLANASGELVDRLHTSDSLHDLSLEEEKTEEELPSRVMVSAEVAA